MYGTKTTTLRRVFTPNLSGLFFTPQFFHLYEEVGERFKPVPC